MYFDDPIADLPFPYWVLQLGVFFFVLSLIDYFFPTEAPPPKNTTEVAAWSSPEKQNLDEIGISIGGAVVVSVPLGFSLYFFARLYKVVEVTSLGPALLYVLAILFWMVALMFILVHATSKKLTPSERVMFRAMLVFSVLFWYLFDRLFEVVDANPTGSTILRGADHLIRVVPDRVYSGDDQ